MNYTEAKTHFIARLKADPQGAAPQLRVGTLAEFHEWKGEMRAFDAARIELGLETPLAVQARNAAVHARQGARILRHARYV